MLDLIFLLFFGGLWNALSRHRFNGVEVFLVQEIVGAVLLTPANGVQVHPDDASHPRSPEGILRGHRLQIDRPHRGHNVFQLVDDKRRAVIDHGLPLQHHLNPLDQTALVRLVVDVDLDGEWLIFHRVGRIKREFPLIALFILGHDVDWDALLKDRLDEIVGNIGGEFPFGSRENVDIVNRPLVPRPAGERKHRPVVYKLVNELRDALFAF